MAEGPTTINGLLHTDEATLSDRRITAYFAVPGQALAVRDTLLQAGVSTRQITVTGASAEAPNLEPADQSFIGKIREAVLPDDGQRATRDAAAHGNIMLTVVPMEEEVDRIVDIIQAAKPNHFDADLERWRNSPPG